MPRDPELKTRHIQEVAELGIKKQPYIKIIRQYCFDCSGDSWKAVKNCDKTNCPHWAYRHGFNPFSCIKNKNFASNISTITAKSNSIQKVHEKYGTFLNNNFRTVNTAGFGGRASESFPVRRLPIVKIAILEWLTSFWIDNYRFYGSDIERIPCPKFCTAETRRRRFRELNEDYNIARCVNARKSAYEIIVDKNRLLEILNILRRHEYGKYHAISETR